MHLQIFELSCLLQHNMHAILNNYLDYKNAPMKFPQKKKNHPMFSPYHWEAEVVEVRRNSPPPIDSLAVQQVREVSRSVKEAVVDLIRCKI